MAAAAPDSFADRSTRDWIAAFELVPRAAAVLEALVRVTSYASDLLSADRAQLWALAEAAGISAADVAV